MLCSYINKKITGKTVAGCTEVVEIMVLLKYLRKFLRTLEMPLISCEINLISTRSDKCALSNNAKATAFAITDTKHLVPAVTLSTQDNAKLLKQLKWDFKRTINWNRYQSKVTIQAPNPFLHYLIDPSFQGVNKLFALSFENNTNGIVHTKYYLPTVEIKDQNFMIGGQNFFDEPVKNILRIFDSIRKIVTGQGDDYTTSCL